MLCPSPARAPRRAPSGDRPRLPLAASAAMAALALAVTACEALPDSLTGSSTDDGQESEGEQTEEGGEEGEPTEADPTDAEAAVRAAADNVEAAESYHVRTFRMPEGGDAFSSSSSRFTYTEDPEPALYYFEAGEGSAGTYLYRTADDTVLGSWYDLPAEVVEEPTRPDEYRTDFGIGGAKLEEILDSSTDLAHEGPEDVTVELIVAADNDSGYEQIEETVSAHRYSGTFTSYHVEYGDSEEQVLSEYEGSTFTLWIDEDGYPALLEHATGGDTETLTYQRFNESEEVVVPEPGEYPEPSIP